MSLTSDIRKAKILLAQRYDRDEITVSVMIWNDCTWSVKAWHTVTTSLSWNYVREVVEVRSHDEGRSVSHYVKVENKSEVGFTTFKLDQLV